MRYTPATYWRNRNNPAPNELPDYAKHYIKAHIRDAVTILDFGVGDGRLLPLYGDRKVIGYDIVPRNVSCRITTELKGYYDCVIASKVLLHVLPDEIIETMHKLRDISDKVIVYDTIASCREPHNFNHDFSKIVDVQEPLIKGKDLLFWYA